ncbi:MAG: response regulator [Deltaproteobacteria bacterium]|nr:response regulator [Deltaproteobacteria bacterium]
MRWFGNLKIRYKLVCAFGLLVSLLFALSIFVMLQIQRLESQYTSMADTYAKRRAYIGEASAALDQMRRINFSKGYLVDAGELAPLLAGWQAGLGGYDAALMTHLQSFRREVLADSLFSDEDRQVRLRLADEVERVYTQEYQPLIEHVDAAVREQDTHKHRLAFMAAVPAGDRLSAAMQQLQDIVIATTAQKMHATAAAIGGVKDALYISAGCTLLFAVAVSLWMAKILNAPIAGMKLAVTEIANGNLSYPIRSARQDELGMLANHIGDMVDSIVEMNKTMAVMDYLDTMICVCDFDYNLLYVNRSLADAYGVDRKHCINQKCYTAIRKRDAPCAFCQATSLVSAAGLFPSSVYKDQWDDVLAAWIGGRASIIRWVDGSRVLFHFFYDETQKKYDEEQLHQAVLDAQAASIAKSAFLANMSHEIRTPMNSIIGFSELALDGALLPKTREYLGKILENSEWLLQIINDILDISKIESGKMHLESIPFNLHELFDHCRTAITPSALEKGIMLHFSVEPSIEKKLLGDPTRLRQVLVNMLSNAVKFTNVGTINLSAQAKHSSADACTIHFAIRDSGIGMTPEQIKKISEPFAQAESGTTRKYGGTGLGLAITRSIIALMGGELIVESALGVGSAFSFDLAFKTLEASGVAPGRKKDDVSRVARPVFAGDVLLCEDNKMNQQVLCAHLARVGLRTLVAENGREGVEMVRSRMQNGEAPFDLIFMDMHMPVMDGLEAAAHIIELNTGTPIVAMTANIMAHDRALYRAGGIHDCVGKPFTSKELWSCLLKYLTPVIWRDARESRYMCDDAKLHHRLMARFVADGQSRYEDITRALGAGDVKLAHRLVHTVKSNAGLLGETRLQQAAELVERLLAGGKMPVAPEHMHMRALDVALRAALQGCTLLLDAAAQPQAAPPPEPLDAERARDLLNALRPLLDSGNPECLKLIDDLRAIPGSEALIRQMEDFDFEPASATLAELQRKRV